MLIKPQYFMVLALVVLCSCAGGVSFGERSPIPEEQIAQLAAEIEELVLNTELDDPIPPDLSSGESLDTDLIDTMIGTDEIRQKAPSLATLGVDNEIVLTAVRGRILRRSAAAEFEQRGCIGESSNGLMRYLGSDWCDNDRDLRGRAGYVVLTENRDRRTIYEQIVEANGLSSSAMARIREIFAEQIHMKAWAGTPLEMPDGSWEKR